MVNANSRFCAAAVFLCTFLFALLFPASVSGAETKAVTAGSLEELSQQIQQSTGQQTIQWTGSPEDGEVLTLTVPEGREITITGGSFSNLVVNGGGVLTLDNVQVEGTDPSTPGILLQSGVLRLTGKTNVSAADGTASLPEGQSAIICSGDSTLLLDDAGVLQGGDGYADPARQVPGGSGGNALVMQQNTTVVASALLMATGGNGGDGKEYGRAGLALMLEEGVQAAFLDKTRQSLTAGKSAHGARSAVGGSGDLYRMRFTATNDGQAQAVFSAGGFEYRCETLSCTVGFALRLEASTEDSGEDVLFAGWQTDAGTLLSEDPDCNILTPAQNTVYTANYTYQCGCVLTLSVEDLPVTMPYYSDQLSLSLLNMVVGTERTGECRLHDAGDLPQYGFAVEEIQVGQVVVNNADFSSYFTLSDSGILTLQRVQSEQYALLVAITASLEDGPSVTQEAQVLVSLGEPADTLLPAGPLSYDLSAQKDLAIEPEWNGNTLVSIVGYHDATNEQIVVNPDVGYYLSDDGSTIYLSADLFSQLSTGDEVRFVFTFSAGEEQQLIVQITRTYSSFLNLPNNSKMRVLWVLLLGTGALALFLRKKFG